MIAHAVQSGTASHVAAMSAQDLHQSDRANDTLQSLAMAAGLGQHLPALHLESLHAVLHPPSGPDLAEGAIPSAE